LCAVGRVTVGCVRSGARECRIMRVRVGRSVRVRCVRVGRVVVACEGRVRGVRCVKVGCVRVGWGDGRGRVCWYVRGVRAGV